jgi:uncharacterized membrane protein
MAIAVLSLMGFTLATPGGLTLLPNWAPVVGEGVLLLVLILADPGRIDRQSRLTWRVSILLVTVLLIGTFAATAILIYDLITDAAVAQAAVPLLIAGARVWIGNNVAFALLYWQLDGGGPAVRLRALPRYPDFAFPQQQNPELARPGWRPHFIDYLYVGFTNANAFSPTDTLPMVSWAKIAMECQALLSFAIIGLVIAHAVNAFA